MRKVPRPPIASGQFPFRAKRKAENELAGYRAACDAHCAEGCRLLGLMYAEARGVAGDYDAAKQNYGAACELGDGDGCHGGAAGGARRARSRS